MITRTMAVAIIITLKSIDYNVAMTFILNNNNSNSNNKKVWTMSM